MVLEQDYMGFRLGLLQVYCPCLSTAMFLLITAQFAFYPIFAVLGQEKFMTPFLEEEKEEEEEDILMEGFFLVWGGEGGGKCGVGENY